MGKGDKKTRRGKIVKGTFGNSRRRKNKSEKKETDKEKQKKSQ